MNLIDFFDRVAATAPQRPAYIFEGKQWTYEYVNGLAIRIAHGLTALGMKRESKCAVLSRNDPLAFTALLGILKASTFTKKIIEI